MKSGGVGRRNFSSCGRISPLRRTAIEQPVPTVLPAPSQVTCSTIVSLGWNTNSVTRAAGTRCCSAAGPGSTRRGCRCSAAATAVPTSRFGFWMTRSVSANAGVGRDAEALRAGLSDRDVDHDPRRERHAFDDRSDGQRRLDHGVAGVGVGRAMRRRGRRRRRARPVGRRPPDRRRRWISGRTTWTHASAAAATTAAATSTRQAKRRRDRRRLDQRGVPDRRIVILLGRLDLEVELAFTPPEEPAARPSAGDGRGSVNRMRHRPRAGRTTRRHARCGRRGAADNWPGCCHGSRP